MRTTAAILAAVAFISFTQADLLGQCQRGGGGRSSQPIARPNQPGGFTQQRVNPVFAMQQAAMQQAFMQQQQVAARQMWMRQVAIREQARQAKLARRRTAAQQRRDAEIARREAVRAANFAKLKTTEAEQTLVALTDE